MNNGRLDDPATATTHEKGDRAMKAARVLLAGAIFTLGGASAAMAGPKVMASAPALALYPSLQTIYCDILNLNTTQKDVTIEIMDYTGTVVSGPSTFTLQPNEGQALGDGTGAGAWCRFTVDGSTKKYRAMAIYDNGTAYTTSVQAY
jgi:hypothetical protein